MRSEHKCQSCHKKLVIWLLFSHLNLVKIKFNLGKNNKNINASTPLSTNVIINNVPLQYDAVCQWHSNFKQISNKSHSRTYERCSFCAIELVGHKESCQHAIFDSTSQSMVEVDVWYDDRHPLNLNVKYLHIH